MKNQLKNDFLIWMKITKVDAYSHIQICIVYLMILYYLFYLSSRSLLVSMLWLRSATAVKWRKDEKLSISNMSSSQTFFKSFCKHFRQQFWFITNWYSSFYNLNAIKKALNYLKSLMLFHWMNVFCLYYLFSLMENV